MVDVGDVEDFETARPICRVEIFAAQDDILNIMTAVFVCFSQKRASVDVLLVIGRVGDRVQMTADCRLRFIRLGPNHSMKPMAALAHIRIAAEEIHCAGAKA